MRILQPLIFGLFLLLVNGTRPMAGQTLSFMRPIPGTVRATAVAAVASGIYVGGNGVSKYDSAGNELWTRAVNGPGFGIATDAAGVYFLGIGQGPGFPQLFLRKYSEAGNELWTHNLQQEFGTGASVAADTSGVYVGARNGFRHSLGKYGSDGIALWTRQWDAPSQGISLAVVTDATGVYALSFGSVANGAGVLARKWDARGNELWQREYATGFPTAFAAANPSGFFVAGGTGYGFLNPSLRRYDAGGNELWNRQLATPALNGLAADASGVYVAGATSPAGPALPGQCRSGSGGDSFMRKYDINGTEVWTREFGGSGGAAASSVAVDSAGVYVAGQEASGLGAVLDLGAFPDAPGPFLAKLEVAKAATGAAPRILPNCIVNAASYVGGGVAPGEIVTLFGSGIGPPDVVSQRPNDDGKLATALADTRIWFNDLPAPLVYVSDQQSTAIVPYAVAGQAAVNVQVEYRGMRSDPVTLPVLPSRPGIFTVDASGQGQGTILNEDGTLNSPSNPAVRGSVISIFGTGGGEAAPGVVDGQLVDSVPPTTSLPVFVFFDIGLGDEGPPAKPGEVLYAGGLSGSVAGLLQVKVRVPANATVAGDSVPLALIIGSQWTAYEATVALR
jgi:uncharacterized protein (TIGR03437 family)